MSARAACHVGTLECHAVGSSVSSAVRCNFEQISSRWNTLRNPVTVRNLLNLVYSDKTSLDKDEALIRNIIEPTTLPIVSSCTDAAALTNI